MLQLDNAAKKRRSRKNTEQQIDIKERLKALKLPNQNLNSSVVCRVNVICEQFNQLPIHKRGLAFIKIMNIFKQFIKKD